MSYQPVQTIQAGSIAPVCVDCEWNRIGYGIRLCGHPYFETTSVVSGYKMHPACAKMRREGERCGPHGDLFQEKYSIWARFLFWIAS